MPNGTKQQPPRLSKSELHAMTSHSMGEFGKKLFVVLAGILLVYLIVWVGTLIRNNVQKYQYLGQAERPQRTIFVEAQGKVTITPDIAVTSMGVTTKAATVVEAQQKNTESMNTLIARVKALGVDAEDIQTANYNVYPEYDYTEEGGAVLKGYAMSQNVSVKIRDLSKAGAILGLAGEVGATDVSGLQFTIDERDVYLDRARQDALEKVMKKTRVLSQTLGVDIVSIVSYNEYESQPPIYAYAETYKGIGGGAAPEIEPGSTDVTLSVSVTFEIR